MVDLIESTLDLLAEMNEFNLEGRDDSNAIIEIARREGQSVTAA